MSQIWNRNGNDFDNLSNSDQKITLMIARQKRHPIRAKVNKIVILILIILKLILAIIKLILLK